MLPSDAFRLGSVTVVPSLNRLAWADRAEDLEPRVMRVLAVLAETPGEVITRGDLLDAVWGETVVNEDALTRAVSELRKALGDEAEAIETIRGRGYRLKTPVRTLPPRPGAPTPPAEAVSVGGRLADGPAAESQVVRPSRRPGPFVLLALSVASLALGVALWAARPEPPEDPGPSFFEALSGSGDAPARPGALRADDRPFRLDSTSPFYRPGMSELGVYYDSAQDRHFRFVPRELRGSDSLGRGPGAP